MRTLITTAVATAALGIAAGLGAARAQEIPAEALVGETLYAPVDPGAVVGAVAEVPADWVALGVVAGVSEEGGALVVEMAEGVGFGAEGVPVRVQDMRLVPDADAEDAYFLVFDGSLRELESEAREVAQDRAAQQAAADGALFGQDDEMAETPGAEGADGVTDEGEPVTEAGGATAGDAEEDAEVIVEGVPVDARTGVDADDEAAVEDTLAPEAQALVDTEGADEAPDAEVVAVEPEPAPDAAEVVVVEPEVVEAEPAEPEVVVVEPERDAEPEVTVVEPADPEPEVVTTPEEPLREVDIAEPGAPPIEDAENVVPSGDQQLPAETEVTSPSTTAAAPEDPTTAVAIPAPEGFAPAEMATMDVTELLGVRVYDRTDEAVGEIESWVGETEPGSVPEAAVIEVGGFLGLGERRVAVASDRLTLMTDTDGNGLRVYTDITEDELEALPEVE